MFILPYFLFIAEYAVPIKTGIGSFAQIIVPMESKSKVKEEPRKKSRKYKIRNMRRKKSKQQEEDEYREMAKNISRLVG